MTVTLVMSLTMQPVGFVEHSKGAGTQAMYAVRLSS